MARLAIATEGLMVPYAVLPTPGTSQSDLVRRPHAPAPLLSARCARHVDVADGLSRCRPGSFNRFSLPTAWGLALPAASFTAAFG